MIRAIAVMDTPFLDSCLRRPLRADGMRVPTVSPELPCMHDHIDPAHDALAAEGHEPPPYIIDRREPQPSVDPVELRSGLTRAQLDTLDTMESFRWRLGFVRWPVFKAPILVLFNRDGSRYVVINEDGSIDEQPTLTLRD